MKILWFIILMLLFSCSNFSENYTIYMDPNLSDYEVEQIKLAASEWELAVSVHFSILSQDHLCDENDKQEICIYKSNVKYLYASYGTGTVGHCYRDNFKENSTIFLAEENLDGTPNEYRLVAEHELGHALGLSHTQKGTLMAPKTTDNPGYITCTDIKQYNSLRGWNTVCN